MTAVDLEAAIGRDDRFLQRRLQRELQLRSSPGKRQARARHQTELQPPRPGHHLLGSFPAIRQVLVVEDRYGAPGLAKDLDDLLHQLEARIEDLALVVAGVVAVLADEEDPLNG